MADTVNECPFVPGTIPVFEMRGFGVYENGLETGKWTYWYGNGQKAKEGEYIEGKKTGYWRSWYPSGEKDGEGWYVDGKQHGWWIAWNRNGEKSSEGQMVEGEKNGIWVHWGDDGSLAVIATHNRGRSDGRCIYWGEAEGNLRQGPVVRVIDWENDAPVKTFIFKDGQMVETEYVEEWWLDDQENDSD
ncbi:MAG: toxin-antitoxin system YwqK family antitoxin [Blastocatellia bacterium]